ncbi:MAG: FecR domain-containing protein [Parabacteroides sp.]|nr:FecR domain-containing protein [Parabacteroides sp.]
MNEKNDIQAFAIRYFEGRSSAEEEKILFHYIRCEKTHYQLFRQWEKAWKATCRADERTQAEWKRLERRLLQRSAFLPAGLRPRYGLWKKAAVVALLIVSTLALHIGLRQLPSVSGETSCFTCEAPYGEKSRIVLSDGTVVWLNAGSRLIYSGKYSSSYRRVTLEGEGYFEVVKKGGAPFTVQTRLYDVVVKGTKFNITAYPEDTYIATTLLEGTVVLDYKGKTIAMHPGESLRLDIPSGRFVRRKTNAAQAKLWAENRIEYDNILLKDLLAKLSRQYNVRIHLAREEAGEKTLCISLRNRETIGEVMTALEQIIPIKIERKGKDIYIR